MTDADTLKLSRIYRSVITDIEDVLGVAIDGSSEQRITQILDDAVGSALNVVECHSAQLAEVQMTELERKVVEESVKWASHPETPKPFSEDIPLYDAVDQLISLREQIESSQ